MQLRLKLKWRKCSLDGDFPLLPEYSNQYKVKRKKNHVKKSLYALDVVLNFYLFKIFTGCCWLPELA
jgi:hypothetical protein